MKRFVKYLFGIVALLFALTAIAIAVLVNLDYNNYKHLVEERVYAATGRTLAINGRLDVDISLSPSVVVTDVTLSNAPWGSAPEMIRLKRLEGKIDLLPLLVSGILDVHRVIVSGLDILVETDAQGRSNFDFSSAVHSPQNQQAEVVQSTSSSNNHEGGGFIVVPVLRDVRLSDITVRYRDGQAGANRLLVLDHLTVGDGKNQTPDTLLPVSLSGTADGVPITATGTLGSPQDMLNSEHPWMVELNGNLAGLNVDLSGSVDDPVAFQGVTLKLAATSTEVGNLSRLTQPLTGQTVPNLGPLHLTSTLNGGLAEGLSLSDLDLNLGRDNLLAVRVTGKVANVFAASGLALSIQALMPDLKRVPVPRGIVLPDVGAIKVSMQLEGDVNGTLAVRNLDLATTRQNVLALSARGNIADAMQIAGLDVWMEASTPNLSRLSTLAGTDLPSLGPISFSTHAMGGLKAGVQADDLVVRIGKSDLTGNITASLPGLMPKIEANLSSTLLRLEDALPLSFADSASSQKAGGNKSTGTTSVSSSDGRVIPNTPLPLEALKQAEAQIVLNVKKLAIAKGSLQRVQLALSLEDGELDIHDLTASDGQNGRIFGNLKLASGAGNPTFNTTLKADNLSTANLVQMAGYPPFMEGPVQMDMALSGKGKTVRSLAGSLDGHVRTSMTSGFLNSAETRKAFGKAAQIVTDMFLGNRGDKKVPLYCFVSDIPFNSGVTDVRTLVLDTKYAAASVDGQADLRNEMLGLTVTPHVTVLGETTVPVKIKGSFAKPSYTPQAEKLLLGLLLGDEAGAILGNAALAEESSPCLHLRPSNREKAAQQQQQPRRLQDPKKALEETGKKVLDEVLDNIFKQQ